MRATREGKEPQIDEPISLPGGSSSWFISFSSTGLGLQEMLHLEDVVNLAGG